MHGRHHHKQAILDRPGATEPKTAPKASTGAKSHNASVATTQDIRLCAYLKWESAGKPTGDGITFWLEAERELMPGK